MDRVSNSNGSPITETRQGAFPSGLCGVCPLAANCDVLGTEHQCGTIPRLPGDIQPGTPLGWEWIAHDGGLDLRLVGHFESPVIPRAIPRICPQEAAGIATQGVPYVAVGLQGVLRANGTRVRSRQKIVEAGKLDPSVPVVLVMAGKDATMSLLGNARSELIASIAEAGYDLVLAPHFSVWNGHSPFHNRTQIVNCDRFASDLAAADIPTIPVAAWYREVDMRDLAKAVNDNPTIRVMWIDWQTIPGGQSMEPALREFDRFAAMVPGVRFIINGVGRTRRESLWERDSVLAVISSREFVSNVCGNCGPEAGERAREAILEFIAEPQLAAARSRRAR